MPMVVRPHFLDLKESVVDDGPTFVPKPDADVPTPFLPTSATDWTSANTDGLHAELKALFSALDSLATLLQLAGYEIDQISVYNGADDANGYLLVDPVDLTYTWVSKGNAPQVGSDYILCDFENRPGNAAIGVALVPRDLGQAGLVDPVPLPADMDGKAFVDDDCLYLAGDGAVARAHDGSVKNVVSVTMSSRLAAEFALINTLAARWKAFTSAYGTAGTYGDNDASKRTFTTGQFGLLGILAPEWVLFWADDAETRGIRKIGQVVYNQLTDVERFKDFLRFLGVPKVRRMTLATMLIDASQPPSSASKKIRNYYRKTLGPLADVDGMDARFRSAHYLSFLYWLQNLEVLHLMPSDIPVPVDREWTQPFLTGTYEQMEVNPLQESPAGLPFVAQGDATPKSHTDTIHLNQAGRAVEGILKRRVSRNPLKIETYFLTAEDVTQKVDGDVKFTVVERKTPFISDTPTDVYQAVCYFAGLDLELSEIDPVGIEDILTAFEEKLIAVIDLLDIESGEVRFRFAKTAAAPFFPNAIFRRLNDPRMQLLQLVQRQPLHSNEVESVIVAMQQLDQVARAGGDAATANQRFKETISWLGDPATITEEQVPQLELARVIGQQYFWRLGQEDGPEPKGDWKSVAKMLQDNPKNTSSIQGFFGIQLQVNAPGRPPLGIHAYDWGHRAAGMELSVDPAQLSTAIAGVISTIGVKLGLIATGPVSDAAAAVTATGMLGGTLVAGWGPDGSLGIYGAEYTIRKLRPTNDPQWPAPAKYIGVFGTFSISLAYNVFPLSLTMLREADPSMLYTTGRWQPSDFQGVYLTVSVPYGNLSFFMNAENLLYWVPSASNPALQWVRDTIVWALAKKKSVGFSILFCRRPGLAVSVSFWVPDVIPGLGEINSNTGTDYFSMTAFTVTLIGISFDIGFQYLNDAPPANKPEIDLFANLYKPVTETESGLSEDVVLFDHDSADLTNEGKATLRKLAIENLQHFLNPNSALRLVGHASLPGSDDYNQKLSMKRARRVYRYLLELLGPNFRISRATVDGHGEREAQRYANTDIMSSEELATYSRRVDIKLNGMSILEGMAIDPASTVVSP